MNTPTLIPRAALAWLLVACASAAACSSPAALGDAAPDVAYDGPADALPTDDAAANAPVGDTAWDVGAHDPMPQVPRLAGPIIAHPQLVVVSFADDPDRADHEADARWIVTSNWLRATGAEYGIGAGTVLGTVARTDNAPDMITDAQIQQLLADGITAGTIPRPAGSEAASVIYAVYLPHHTTVTHPAFGSSGTETSCRQFGGYHNMAHQAGLDYAYLVVAGCDNLLPPLTQLQHEQFYLSHELFEAATDPDPVGNPAYLIAPAMPPSPWGVVFGDELADLCTVSAEYVTESGFIATRIWSNAAALAGRDNPCVPQDPTRPYFNMSASPSYAEARPGQLVTVTLRGWSNGPVPAWQVSYSNRGTFTPALMVRSQMLNNGQTTQLGVTVPAGTPSGSYALIAVVADGGALGVFGWPLLVVVP
jgi:hypothetical protein